MNYCESKILTYETALSLTAMLRTACYRLVITNGCFDIIHAGHVGYLMQAANAGDILIVGVNTDQAVKSLKGPTRPINKLEDRMRVVAAMGMVKYVVPIDSIRVHDFIRDMRANVWVKGGYTIATLDKGEMEAAHSVGTRIMLVDNIQGYSTTNTLEQIHCQPATK